MNPVLAAWLLLLAGNLFSALYDLVLKLIDGDQGLLQFLFWRHLLALGLLLPWTGLVKVPAKKVMQVHLARGVVALLGALAVIQALQSLPLGTFMALFLSAPVQMVILAALFFGERPSRPLWIATFLGLAGVCLIVRPGSLHADAWLGFASGTAFALGSLLLKKLPADTTSKDTLWWQTLLPLPFLALGAWWEGKGPNLELLSLALLANLTLLVYQWTVVVAYRRAPVALVAGAEYTGLLYSLLLGYWWFAEIPNAWMLAGATLIVLPMLWSQLRHHRSL
ncbi:DMT family transporter [Gallaecimonas xiamenensis]|uniref:Permease n=1 Tax=Gallaecimonas xiamenensis 3-C-1 TaxID=745411 RepID=K2K453_9GAMM|nr:DMT family transporter [Gallaecimonas xiamenensis]EKE72175.1 permease [Gallaecimonas xiamenensis 3-C-1]